MIFESCALRQPYANSAQLILKQTFHIIKQDNRAPGVTRTGGLWIRSRNSFVLHGITPIVLMHAEMPLHPGAERLQDVRGAVAGRAGDGRLGRVGKRRVGERQRHDDADEDRPEHLPRNLPHGDGPVLPDEDARQSAQRPYGYAGQKPF